MPACFAVRSLQAILYRGLCAAHTSPASTIVFKLTGAFQYANQDAIQTSKNVRSYKRCPSGTCTASGVLTVFEREHLEVFCFALAACAAKPGAWTPLRQADFSGTTGCYNASASALQVLLRRHGSSNADNRRPALELPPPGAAHHAPSKLCHHICQCNPCNQCNSCTQCATSVSIVARIT